MVVKRGLFDIEGIKKTSIDDHKISLIVGKFVGNRFYES